MNEPAIRMLMDMNSHLSATEADALPMKLRGLCANEYRFFRGAADCFYAWCRDHAPEFMADEVPRVLLHGDTHFGNLGTYQAADAPDMICFGVVDLDEAVEGPYALDLLHALTAARFAADANGLECDDGFWRKSARGMCDAYADAMRGRLESAGLSERFKIVARLMDKARAEDPGAYLEDYCRGKPPGMFRRVREKKGAPTDLMRSLDAESRREVVDALWMAVESGAWEVGDWRRALGSRSAMDRAVRDVARWARLGSAGSQGLQKYLILLHVRCDDVTGECAMIQLKEQPRPAAERAGLLSGETDRGAQVAGAYRAMLRPGKHRIGHANVFGRPFLIKPKDCRGKEPDFDDFDSPKELAEGADLLGACIGQAHRNALRQSDRVRLADRMARHAVGMADELSDRSGAAERDLRAAYVKISRDAEVRRSIEQADAWIEIQAGRRD